MKWDYMGKEFWSTFSQIVFCLRSLDYVSSDWQQISLQLSRESNQPADMIIDFVCFLARSFSFTSRKDDSSSPSCVIAIVTPEENG